MLTYMQHMSHHLSDTCVFVFWKCPNMCLQYVWCSVFICFVCGTYMFSIMNSLCCFAFSKCFVYAQSKWFTYAHQMFYMCKSNDGMSHGNKTVSVHMEFIMFTWFVYHSRPPTHIRKDTCNIYAPYMQNISLFCVMIYDSYMIAICFYAINMRNTYVATYVLYMFTYAKFTRICMWYVCVCSVAALQKQALHSSWI